MNRRRFARKLLGVAGGLLAARAAWPTFAGAQAAGAGSATGGADHPSMDGARVNGARLNETLRELARFGATPEGGISRVAYSEADLEARAFVTDLMRSAGLQTRIDTAGNIIGSRAGSDATLRPLMFGSHIDSVRDGGNYDGQVGSMCALEVARTLADHDVATRHPLDVVIFANEEGGLYGSRAIAGMLRDAELEQPSASGFTIREGIHRHGGDPDRLAEAQRQPGDIAAFLELHIEQGGVLYGEGIDIGVVTGIVGVYWWDVIVEGFANHAGTTPMDQRQDALLAAARFIQEVNRIVTAEPGRQVGTVGRIRSEPGLPNVIPGRVVHSLELRDLDADKVDALYQRIVAASREIGEASGVRFRFESLQAIHPAPADTTIMRAIERSAESLGLRSLRMPSGAGHDAQAIATLAPVGMIFVPSVDGISHSPREFSRPDDIENGANVLLHSVLELDGMLPVG